jgi:predicted RND superfamily exporter protein
VAIQRSQGPGKKTRAFVTFTLRHGKLLWAIAILLAIPATWRTVKLYANLKSDLEELLPRKAPSVVAIDEMRARNSGLQYLGVVVDTGSPQSLASGERFLDDLSARIQAYPPDMVRSVRVGTSEERKFVETHAPLYVELDDLKKIRERIETRRDFEVSHASGTALDEDEPPPPVDMSDMEAKYKSRIGSGGQGTARFSSSEQHVTMLFVEVGGFSTGADKARSLLDHVKRDVKDLEIGKYAPGMRVGYASDVAISVEELEALQADLSLASVLVILAVMGVIVAYYRWWRSIPVLIPPLLLATVYAFAIASLPPFNITELNSNTAFLGTIIVGNGINFSLILLARYREERGRMEGIERSLELALWGARPGTLAAALAAGASYASLIITEFRGFRQFGFIGGLGMLFSWGVGFLLIPSLLRQLDREGRDTPLPPGSIPPPPESRPSLMTERKGSIMRWVAKLAHAAPMAIVIATTLLTVAATWKVAHFNSNQLEYDFAKLRRYDTWKNGEGYWGRKMDNLLGHYLTPTIIMFDTPDEARASEKKIRESFEHGTLNRYIAEVRSIDDVLPKHQDEKIAEVNAIKNALTPAVRGAIPKEKLDKLDEIVGPEKADLQPVKIDDLPPTFLTGLRERDGTIGRQILVYPRPNDFLWQAEPMHEFVKTLRDLSSDHPSGFGPYQGRVAGSIPLTSDILDSIGRDAPIASIASLAGVILVVLVIIRRPKATAYVIGSLIIGVVWLAGATMALGVKINFANFIAFPITFGIGVDYAVNVIARYEQDGEADVRGAIMSTGGAVGLASLTTIIGYSSLLIAKTRALFYFGVVAVMGEVSCLTTAVIALPALLLLLQRRKEV